MASPALTARLRYLHNSAHLLALASPPTSAFMQTEFHRLALDSNLKLPEARRREVCGACGSIFVPGINAIVRQQSLRPPPHKVSRKEKAKQRSSVVESTTTTVYTCNRCSRKTLLVSKTQPSPKPSAAESKAASAIPSPTPLSASLESSIEPSTPTASSTASPAAAATVPSANASSKKRAKARKQGSLQAALAKSRTGPPASSSGGGFGLDLMDLMKTD